MSFFQIPLTQPLTEIVIRLIYSTIKISNLLDEFCLFASVQVTNCVFRNGKQKDA